MGPLLVLAAVVAVVIFAMRGRARSLVFPRADAARSMRETGARTETVLDEKLHEWERAGLVRTDQIAPIEAYETSHKPAHPSRLPLTSEAIGYLGGALVAAAVIVQVAQRWEDLGLGKRLVALAVPSVLLATVGWRLGQRAGDSFVRLGSVLWLLAAIGVGGLAAVTFVDGIHGGDPPEHGVVLFIGAASLPFVVGAWWARREPLQQLVAFAASVLTVFGLVDAITEFEGDGALVSAGLAVYSLGALWLALGMLDRVEPALLAVLLGAVTLIISPQTVTAGSEHLGLWLGVSTVIALVSIGAARGRVEVLLIGTVGMFLWLPQVSLRYLGDRLGTTATLLLIGTLLLGVAASLSRMVPAVRRHRAEN